jgi:hypothetical protein
VFLAMLLVTLLVAVEPRLRRLRQPLRRQWFARAPSFEEGG